MEFASILENGFFFQFFRDIFRKPISAGCLPQSLNSGKPLERESKLLTPDRAETANLSNDEILNAFCIVFEFIILYTLNGVAGATTAVDVYRFVR